MYPYKYSVDTINACNHTIILVYSYLEKHNAEVSSIMIAELQQSGHEYPLAEVKRKFVNISKLITVYSVWDHNPQRLFIGYLMASGGHLQMASHTEKGRLLKIKRRQLHGPCRIRFSNLWSCHYDNNNLIFSSMPVARSAWRMGRKSIGTALIHPSCQKRALMKVMGSVLYISIFQHFVLKVSWYSDNI